MTNHLMRAVAFAAALSASEASARNTPCSGSKGGVDHCSNGKFICADGSVSASNQTCSAPPKDAQSIDDPKSGTKQHPPKPKPRTK
jgi:hypothetical protein